MLTGLGNWVAQPPKVNMAQVASASVNLPPPQWNLPSAFMAYITV